MGREATILRSVKSAERISQKTELDITKDGYSNELKYTKRRRQGNLMMPCRIC